MNNDFKIIIQARVNSSRLPGKMVLPFFNGKVLLEMVIEKLLRTFERESIIIATTEISSDDSIANIALKYGVQCFRGDENNVLERFIHALDGSYSTYLIRVCADNPFLLAEYVTAMLDSIRTNDLDYVSYGFPDGTPTIRSHIGMFAEVVKLSALIDVSLRTEESRYLEHVTNYVYEHPEFYKCQLLSLPKNLELRKDIRLTIDTIEDFLNMQELIGLTGEFPTMEEIIQSIERNPHILQKMETQIKLNSK